jgi:hypothetical protein
MMNLTAPGWTCQSETHASLPSLFRLTKSQVRKNVTQQQKRTKSAGMVRNKRIIL